MGNRSVVFYGTKDDYEAWHAKESALTDGWPKNARISRLWTISELRGTKTPSEQRVVRKFARGKPTKPISNAENDGKRLQTTLVTTMFDQRHTHRWTRRRCAAIRTSWTDTPAMSCPRPRHRPWRCGKVEWYPGSWRSSTLWTTPTTCRRWFSPSPDTNRRRPRSRCSWRSSGVRCCENRKERRKLDGAGEVGLVKCDVKKYNNSCHVRKTSEMKCRWNGIRPTRMFGKRRSVCVYTSHSVRYINGGIEWNNEVTGWR